MYLVTENQIKINKNKEVNIMKEEMKEIDFGNLELKIAKPSLATDKTIIVSGNFS